MSNPAKPATNDQARIQRPSVWLGAAIVGAFWIFQLVIGSLELTIFQEFLSRVAAGFLLILAFAIWWLTNGSIRRGDRWLALLAGIVLAVATVPLSDRSVGVFGVLFFGVPIVCSAWVVWLWLARNAS